jgi:hypothetical protein
MRPGDPVPVRTVTTADATAAVVARGSFQWKATAARISLWSDRPVSAIEQV